MTKSKHINQKWKDKTRVIEAALTTNSCNDFKKRFAGAYRAAKYNLLFYEELYDMMVAKGVWKEHRKQSQPTRSKYSTMSDEQIIQIALQSETLSELHRKFLLCVEAKRRGIYKQIEDQFHRLIHENNYWTIHRIYDKARESNSRTEFAKESACRAAIRLGIYDKLVEDMLAEGVWDSSHYNHWTKETCMAKIREYETKSELIEDSWGAYLYARKHGFLDEACKNMEKLGNAVLRKIYVFEFSDHSAYIGLSYNPQARLQRHLSEKDSAVYLHIKSTNCEYEFKILTDFISKDKAAIQEEFYKQQYEDMGWNILNRVKCGSLGGIGGSKYTKEYIREEIKRRNFKTKTEFNQKAKGMYLYAWRNNWLDDICKDMPQREKSTKKIKWNTEMVNWAINQCSTRVELHDTFRRAYQILHDSGKLDDYFPIKTRKQ